MPLLDIVFSRQLILIQSEMYVINLLLMYSKLELRSTFIGGGRKVIYSEALILEKLR